MLRLGLDTLPCRASPSCTCANHLTPDAPPFGSIPAPPPCLRRLEASNEVPSPEEEEDLRTGLSQLTSLRTHAEATLAGITETRAADARATAWRIFHYTVRQAEEARGRVLHPLRRVPSEILQQIFQMAVTSEKWDVDEPGEGWRGAPPYRPPNNPLWAVELACRRWRCVVLENPRLWSTICIDAVMSNFYDDEKVSYPRRVATHLARSGAVPLSVCIYSGSDDSIPSTLVHMLLPFASRICTLLLCIPKEKINDLSPLRRDLTSLTRLNVLGGGPSQSLSFFAMHVSVFRVLQSPSEVSLPCSLRDLVLDAYTIADPVISLLEQAGPCVERVRLDTLQLTQQPSRRISMSMLTGFSLLCSNRSVCYILDNLVLPNLLNLEIRGRHPPPVFGNDYPMVDSVLMSAAQMVIRSGCALARLCLYHISIFNTQTGWLALARAALSLTEVHIVAYRYICVPLNVLLPRDAFPGLKALHLTCCFGKNDVESVLDWMKKGWKDVQFEEFTVKWLPHSAADMLWRSMISLEGDEKRKVVGRLDDGLATYEGLQAKLEIL
ncbi:hypothetical protein BDZ89DRAFT_1073898 [Hymenopellis radicata]|nr:hypothetical protein BDZ89DRAFT_1073898 [Hymenopellis radicata]